MDERTFPPSLILPADLLSQQTPRSNGRTQQIFSLVFSIFRSGMYRKIKLVRLAHVFYTHRDIDAARTFLEDFGMQETKRVGDEFYFRGTSSEPFVYCARKGEEDAFGGAAFVVESESDLEAAQSLPGATNIYHLSNAPGGGKCVTFFDPVDNFPLHLVHGQIALTDVKTLPLLDFNFVSSVLPFVLFSPRTDRSCLFSPRKSIVPVTKLRDFRKARQDINPI